MKASNENLKQKVAELEKKVDKLHEDHTSVSKTKKLQPSREVRVSNYTGISSGGGRVGGIELHIKLIGVDSSSGNCNCQYTLVFVYQW